MMIKKTNKGGDKMEKSNLIIDEIIAGENKYFSYSHFVVSNMSDYTLMSTTIQDLTAVYDINEVEAAEVVQSLTH